MIQSPTVVVSDPRSIVKLGGLATEVVETVLGGGLPDESFNVNSTV